MDELIPMLFAGLDDAYARLRRRLDGIIDAEYLWEPVPDVWTMRLTVGRWLPDRTASQPEEPDPAPVTTIAWRMWHIASFLASFVSPHLGGWPLVAPDGEWWAEATRAVQDLETAYAAFKERVTGLGENGIRTALGPDWGPYAEDSWADLVVHTLDELAHHGAEVALLRDLYRRLG